jgi:hypothetical protein
MGRYKNDFSINGKTPFHGGDMKRKVLVLSLMTVLAAGAVHAQIITGGLYGNEPSAAGSTVVVTSRATGYRKEVQVDKSGHYKLDGLSPGTYTVTVSRAGKVVGARSVQVPTNGNAPVATIATAAQATSAAGGNATTLGTVHVNGAETSLDLAPIDVSTPTFTNHYDMGLVQQLPTGQGMESIALLRSDVVYDGQTTGLAVINGASPAENRYFYNGFDTTNDFTGVGANRLPPEALQGVDTIHSSATASWTNVTGGLYAGTVRQGTNEFQGGYTLYFTPATSSLNPASPNSYYTDGDGNRQYYRYSADNRHSGLVTQYAWGAGPLIKDTLFLFAMVGNSPNQQTTSYDITHQYDSTTRDKNGLLNLTWDITSDQTADLVVSKDVGSGFTNQYGLTQNYTPSSVGAYKGWGANTSTNKFLIGNYNWRINDTMSLVLMGGYLSQDSISPTSSSGTGLPYVTEVNPVTQQSTNIGISNTANALNPVNYAKRGYTAKFNWQLGDHQITLGAEHYAINIYNASLTTPGGDWTYYTAPAQGTILTNGTAVPGNTPYVAQYFLQNGGTFNTINKAAFLEDYWQVADRWVVYMGVRDDMYTNKNVNGQNFMRMPLPSPRLGVAWDVNGDSSTKIGANLGKYGLSVPTSVNAGAAGATYAWWRWYTYTGRDPETQAPTGLTQLGPQSTAINGLSPANYNVASSNIKAPDQYELQVYWQQALKNGWSFNLDTGFSKLERIIDDECWNDGITAYADSHGYPNYVDQSGCTEINPGYAQVFTRDYAGNGQLSSLTLPADFFGPKSKRNYAHATFELMHVRTDDQPYTLDLSYTWAHLYGNVDGYLDLSNRYGGGGGESPLWDYPGLMEYSNGDLASDIRSSVKLDGIYYFKSGLRLSSIVTMHTGQPLSCLGSHPEPDPYEGNYDGPINHYCNNIPQPAGTAGRLPFYWQWDVGAGYDWLVGAKNHMSLDLQIQNVTNRKGVIDSNQTFDTGQELSNGYWQPNYQYGALSYQAPRTTTLVFRYSFK